MKGKPMCPDHLEEMPYAARVIALVGKLDPATKAHDLVVAYGPQTIPQLASQLQISRQQMQAVANRMITSGLVKRIGKKLHDK